MFDRKYGAPATAGRLVRACVAALRGATTTLATKSLTRATVAALLTASASPALADVFDMTSIPTTHTGRHGLYFDLEAGDELPFNLKITSISVNPLDKGGTYLVYKKSDTYVGSEGVPSAWTQVFGGAGGAPDIDGVLDIQDVVLPASGPVGFYVYRTDDGQHYALLSGSENNPSPPGDSPEDNLYYPFSGDSYFTPDLALSIYVGGGNYDAFSVSTLASRTFVGAVTYEVVTPVPEPAPLMLLGTGLLAVVALRRRRG